MTMYLATSFRMERIGTATITWGGSAVSVSTGHYCHLDLSDYDSACTSFAAALQAAAVAAGFASALVTYSHTAHAYTLRNGGGAFALAFPSSTAGALMARILGFDPTTSASATSHTGTVRPYYVIVPSKDGRSRYSGLRQVARSMRRQADDGRGFSLSTSDAVYTGQWEHWHESLAATFTHSATSSVPWTWEHLWTHAGRWQEYVLVQPDAENPEPPGIWQLTTPDFDESTHERHYADGDFAWKIRIAAVRLFSRRHPSELYLSLLRLWLDRRRSITYGASPAVRRWGDLTTNANHANQATAAQQPTVVDGGLDFDGTDDRLVVTDAASLDQTTALTVFFHAAFDVVTGNQAPVTKSTSLAGSWSFQTNAAALRFHIGAPGSTFGEGGTLVAFASSRVIVVYDGSATGNANRLKMWINGTAITLAFTGTIPATITAGTADVWLGAFSNAAQFFNGQVRCVGVVQAVASASEVTAIDAYMRTA